MIFVIGLEKYIDILKTTMSHIGNSWLGTSQAKITVQGYGVRKACRVISHQQVLQAKV